MPTTFDVNEHSLDGSGITWQNDESLSGIGNTGYDDFGSYGDDSISDTANLFGPNSPLRNTRTTSGSSNTPRSGMNNMSNINSINNMNGMNGGTPNSAAQLAAAALGGFSLRSPFVPVHPSSPGLALMRRRGRGGKGQPGHDFSAAASSSYPGALNMLSLSPVKPLRAVPGAVSNTKQEIIISKYTNNITKVVGFQVVQDIVTVDDDNTLYDNQGSLPNQTAPGADRFRIRLVLTTQDLITSGQTFVYVANIVDSKIAERVTGLDQYNLVNDLMAVRTNDESGDYTVTPFFIRFEDSA
mgnify:CR=1 FL=1